MFSRLWLRLGKFGLALLIVYLILAYGIVITIIVREEVDILDASKVVSVINPLRESTVAGQVRNVFGDPIPHAVLVIDGQIIQADNGGGFSINQLAPGRYTLEIFAGDYAKYTREIHVEEGMNYPTIKYESGLWPQVFMADFHVFFKDANAIFGMVGFANGTDEPIYIERASILDPQGNAIYDLLHDNDGFSYYTDLSNKLEVVEIPQRALKWAPHMVQSGEFPPIAGSFRPGPYSLEVHYAFQAGHDLGLYQVLTITDHLDLDNDWNPHLPDPDNSE